MRQIKKVAITSILMMALCYSLALSQSPTNQELANGMLSIGREVGSVKRGMLAMGGEIGSIKRQIATNSDASLSKDDVVGMLKRKASSKSLNALRDDMETADAQATVRAFTTEAALLDAAGYSAEERLAFDKLDPVKDAVARRVFLAEAYKRLIRNMALEMLTNPNADANKGISTLFMQRVGEIAPRPVDLSGYAKTSDIPKPVDLSGYAKTSDIPKPVDLSGYAKTSDIPKPVDLSGYAKTSDLEDYASQGDLDHVAGQAKQAKDAATVLAIGGHFGADKEAARIILGLSEEDAKKIAKKAKELGLK